SSLQEPLRFWKNKHDQKMRRRTRRRETVDRKALDLRPAHQQALHPQRMEQLRHRLTNVSPKGQTCRAAQNPLKRSDLDDLESPAVGSHPLRVACYNPMNRHERKE